MTLAYWCVAFMMALPWGYSAYAKKLGGFRPRDNHDPRAFQERLQGAAKRMQAAQQNTIEAFAPFAAAVIIASVSHNASQITINVWAILFVLCRLGYGVCYLKDWASARSSVWALGMLCIVALFIAAI